MNSSGCQILSEEQCEQCPHHPCRQESMAPEYPHVLSPGHRMKPAADGPNRQKEDKIFSVQREALKHWNMYHVEIVDTRLYSVVNAQLQ